MKKFLWCFVLLCFGTGLFFCQENSQSSEVTEDTKEKDKETILYGLDDDIIALLDEFTQNQTYFYLDEIFATFERTRSVALRDKIIYYFTVAEDNRLKDYALEVLEDPFDTSDSTVSLLFKYVSQLKIEEAAPLARALLENEYVEYFDAALTALSELGTGDDALFLAEYIDREDLTLVQRQSVMKALGRLKAVETWDALVSIVQDEEENSFIRMYAAEAIGAMEKEETVDVLAPIFETKDSLLRASVVKAMGYYPQNETAKAIIIEGIRDSHYKVRLEGIAAAKEHSMTDAAPYIFYRAKNDPETSVKYAAYDALVALNYEEGVEYLQTQLKNTNFSDAAKVEIAKAFIKYNNGSGINVVIEVARETLKDDKKKNLRYALGKLFASYENASFADICKEYLASADVATVGTGLDMYAKNKFPSVTAEVEKIAADEKSGVNKNKAQKILDRE